MINKFFVPEECSMQKTYIWTVMAGLIYAGSSFLMQMFTSKFIGLAEAGILSLALAVGNQLITVGLYNIRTFQVSDVTEKYKFGDYCVLRTITVAFMILVGIVWIAAGDYTAAQKGAIILAVVFRGVEAVSDLFEGRYQQKGRYDVSCRDVSVKVISYLVAFLSVLFITRSVVWALTALSIVYIIMFILIDGRIISCFGGVSFSTTLRRQKNLLLEGLPLFINAFLNAYIINASKYVLEDCYGSEALGIFTPLYMLAFVVNMFTAFVLKPIISVLAENYVKKEIKVFLKLVVRQVAVILAVTLLCMAGGGILGIPVLNLLYGVDLNPYKSAMYLIIISGGFTALYQLLQYGIIIMRHQYSTLICCGATTILTFFLTPYLVKKYEIIGASMSYTIAIGFMAVMFLAFFIVFLVKDWKNKCEETNE